MLDKVRLKKGDFYVLQKPFSEAAREVSFDAPEPFVVMSYAAFGEIDLEAEINGDSLLLTSLAEMSLKNRCAVFCGITTQILGLKHISVAVCYKGSLVDIVDRTAATGQDDYLPSERIKIFAHGDANIAVLVDTDVLLEKNWEKAAPHCNVIINVIKDGDERMLNSVMDMSEKYGDIEVIAVTDSSIRWKSAV